MLNNKKKWIRNHENLSDNFGIHDILNKEGALSGALFIDDSNLSTCRLWRNAEFWWYKYPCIVVKVYTFLGSAYDRRGYYMLSVHSKVLFLLYD